MRTLRLRWVPRQPFKLISRHLLHRVAAWGAVAVAALATVRSGPGAHASDLVTQPNIVFILADDLGWTDLGCQGSKYYETPNIDRLAAGGLRFTDGYTCGPNCQPTRSALMSGQYGPRTGTYTVGSIDRFNWQSRPLRPVDNVVQLPLDRTTIAGALKSAGYATGMFGKWHLGNDGEHHPAKRGFDEAIVSAGRHFDFNTVPPTEYAVGTYLADFLTDQAVDRKDVGAQMPTPNKTGSAARDNAGPFHTVQCEGSYPGHLQGACTNDRDAIYWCFTTVLVKTDANGRVLKKIGVASHHGDLCFHDGKLYVAVNLGLFNLAAGRADSWVYVYDAQSLEELARHKTPEVVHGAGGIGFRDGHFFVVGGLPPGVAENYVYEYDGSFAFQARQVLAGGHTLMGIQTAAFARDRWWFGCYGNPRLLLVANKSLKPLGRFHVDASLGIVGTPDGKLLVATGSRDADNRNLGRLELAVPDDRHGLRPIR